ncbi:hypothetical protein TWF481_011841 [Arthrobotrys musiformis]|uniref:Uncharacterized protein n=1 Tax=Arthrobotrys musiformis TaxID=47236 RepID=A0AAV9VWD1_9PEZI
MSEKENTIRYNIVTSPGSSLAASTPPSHRLKSSLPAHPSKPPLLTTNPAVFIRDSIKTSIETWTPQQPSWIYRESLQCPILKFALKDGRAIVFACGRLTKTTPLPAVRSYALVWSSRSIASWASDIHCTKSTEGFLEVSFAMRFIDTPQLIAFGGGNCRPVVIRPQQLSMKYDYLRKLAGYVQTQLEAGSAVWLRFSSGRPVHPASRTLAESYTVPRMLPLSTDAIVTAFTASKIHDTVLRKPISDSNNTTPPDAILIDLTPTPPTSPHHPPTSTDLLTVTPPLTYTESLKDEPAALTALNDEIANSATEGGGLYHAALKRKQQFLERLWSECTDEMESVLSS